MFASGTHPSARYETLGAQSASSRGQTLTASATAHVMGGWSSIGGTTSFAYEQLTIILAYGSTLADFFVDIGITVGAQTFVLIKEITYCARAASYGGPAISIPIHIPAGAQLAGRCRSNTGSATVEVVLVGGSTNPGGIFGCHMVQKLFTDSTSISRGSSVDGNTSTPTKSADYTTLIASSDKRVSGVFVLFDYAGDTARTAARWLCDIAVGSSGAERGIFKNILLSVDAASDFPFPILVGPLSCDVSSGTRWSARLANTDTTAGNRVVGISLYGLVP